MYSLVSIFQDPTRAESLPFTRDKGIRPTNMLKRYK